MPDLYRPSNGTEGSVFMERWCATCQRDAEFDDECGGAGCEIAAMALGFDIDAPEYPREWVVSERGPICTAWEPLPDNGTGRLEDIRQTEMFADA